MSDDALNVELCHTIRICWKTLRGQQAFKAVAIDTDLANMLPDEFAPKMQITNAWACGSSANRLCEVLVGEQLENYINAMDAVRVSNTGALDTELTKIGQTVGCILVRINVIGGNAGHSYIFLSNQHNGVGPIKGSIYQTNVGCHRDSAFDLMAWIDDPKSKTTVDLKEHLDNLKAKMMGSARATNASGAYQQNYMLSTKQLTDLEISDINLHGTAADFILMWRAVDQNAAMTRLKALRTQSKGAVKWAPVATQTGFRSHG